MCLKCLAATYLTKQLCGNICPLRFSIVGKNALKAEKDDPVVVNALVESMHHNLYTIINSAAMNGVGPETIVKAVTPGIIYTVTYITIAIAAAAIFFIVLRRRIVKKKKKNQ